MRTPPSIAEIKRWLIQRNPLGLFRNKNFTLKDIDPKPWSGHFNYLVKARSRSFVLRFRGPEWGEVNGIIDEYEILRAVSRHKVGPRVYCLRKDFFGEPMALQEYLAGKPLGNFSPSTQKKFFPRVARLIAKISAIPLKGAVLRRQSRLTYERDKEAWRQRLQIILENRRTRPWGLRIKKLLPRAGKMLNEFEVRLKRVLRGSGPVFIFESSHVGHCMATARGLRFINWENISHGDPSYTLAVFLASISDRPDFKKIKEKMIKEYLRLKPVPEFKELVEQRLKEREISNLIWVLWAYVCRKDTRPVEKGTGAGKGIRKVTVILNQY